MSRYITLFDKLTWHVLNIDDFNIYNVKTKPFFSRNDTILTFQVSELIRTLNVGKYPKLPNIIDLESFDKQFSQSGSDIYDFQNWSISKMLKYHNINFNDIKHDVNQKKQLLEQLASLYLELINSKIEENERFEETEMKINKIIYNRQLKGIGFDKEIAEKKSKLIEKEIYRIKNELQLEHNIFQPDNQNQQREWLVSKEYKIIQSLQNSFEIKRNDDKVCSLFYELIRNQQDLESFLIMLGSWGANKRTYPSFIGFGTITSRITVRQPSLQNIRKINRDVIVPDEFKKLLYVDYSQFEAGILASLSEDNDLIELYNQDIYKDLAKFVFKDENKRKEAKIIFYRYMYGDTSLGYLAKEYFKKFIKLNDYVNKIKLQILSEKKIGTIEGNFRLSENEETTWGLSHQVQATASLIFKKALIAVSKNVPSAEFLIPMHDAALYQIKEDRYEISKIEIIKIFKTEFKRVCNKINVEVTSGGFFIDPIIPGAQSTETKR